MSAENARRLLDATKSGDVATIDELLKLVNCVYDIIAASCDNKRFDVLPHLFAKHGVDPLSVWGIAIDSDIRWQDLGHLCKFLLEHTAGPPGDGLNLSPDVVNFATCGLDKVATAVLDRGQFDMIVANLVAPIVDLLLRYGANITRRYIEYCFRMDMYNK